jgi:hypothetical protein
VLLQRQRIIHHSPFFHPQPLCGKEAEDEKHKTMKIHPRYYPAIILGSFVIFLLIGFLLGFRPVHNEEGRGLLLILGAVL